MAERKKFAITMHKGFQLTFENGIVASVQFGAGNYCENHTPMDFDFSFSKDAKSDDAEIAAFRASDGRFVTQHVWPERCFCDDVVGWLSPEEVLEFLQKCKDFDPANIKESDGDNDE